MTVIINLIVILFLGVPMVAMACVVKRLRDTVHMIRTTAPRLSSHLKEDITKMLDERDRMNTCDHTSVRFHNGTRRMGGEVKELIAHCTICMKEWPIYNGPMVQKESKDVQKALLMDKTVAWTFKNHVDRNLFSEAEIQAFVTLGILTQPDKGHLIEVDRDAHPTN